MKAKKKLNIKTTKMSFEKTTVLELNQLRKIKGGGNNDDTAGGNDDTYSLTDVDTTGQDNLSCKCK